MTTARLSIRITEQLKSNAKKASALSGCKSLSDYVASVLKLHSTEVITRYERITIGCDPFDRFMDACNKVNKPSSALINAVQFAKEQGFK